MEGFEDDFSPLQGSTVPSNLPTEQSESNDDNAPAAIDTLDAAEYKDGDDDVPALRRKNSTV